MSDSNELDSILPLIASGVVEAHGAVARGDPLRVPYPASLQRGLDRLTLACLCEEQVAPAGVPELLRWCEEPLDGWPVPLGGADAAGAVLLEAGIPTRECQEWAVEARDVEAELIESQIVAAVRRACRAAGREDSYVRFRELVIQRPVLAELEFQQVLTERQLVPVSEQVKACYPPAPIECDQGGIVECCRDCGNLLILTADGRLCVDDRCPRRSTPKVGRTMDLALGVRWLAAPVRMFVASPGRAELRLRDALRDETFKKAGVEVELWPNFDAYDLRITFPDGEAWAVDVKDWSNPARLARRLRALPSDPPWDRSFIVPAREAVGARPGYLQTLKARSKAQRRRCQLEVASERELIRKVRARAEMADA